MALLEAGSQILLLKSHRLPITSPGSRDGQSPQPSSLQVCNFATTTLHARDGEHQHVAMTPSGLQSLSALTSCGGFSVLTGDPDIAGLGIMISFCLLCLMTMILTWPCFA